MKRARERNQRATWQILSPVVILAYAAVVNSGYSAQDDPAIYEAVIQQGIRPTLERESAAAGIPTPAQVIVVAQTLALSSEASVHRDALGCVRDEWIQSLETLPPRWRSLTFENVLTPAIRKELAKSFRERNRQNTEFPGTRIPQLILANVAEIREVWKRESKRARGFVKFSRPAYSSHGRAMVVASYTCGAMCGYGWLFLLERGSDGWRVISNRTLYVS